MMTDLEDEVTKLSRESEKENVRNQLINEIEDTDARVDYHKTYLLLLLVITLIIISREHSIQVLWLIIQR